jgi:flagellar hook-associated protein 2
MEIQLAGLASGFDWKTFVDTIMNLERTPINRLNSEKNTNSLRSNALTTLNTNLTSLQIAVAAFDSSEDFATQIATITGASSTWSASASSTAARGTHDFEVLDRATTARLEGATDLGESIAATADVSGVTLATMGTHSLLSAGVFTINGAKITLDTADSLQDLFDQISTATGGDVTASYNPATDGIELASASSIMLGAANDTSNFFSVARLTNNGTNAISSATALGAVKLNAPLDSARLNTAITAVDGAGAGSFSINGESISYNITTDSLSSIITRINQSNAGVTAAFDPVLDRMILSNGATGDIGISVSEAAGGLLGALGLTSGTTFVAGTNARFTANGGPEISSTSNLLTAAEHGITGITLNATTTGTGTLDVKSDTSSMRAKIDRFISAFNSVQRFIESESKITSVSGKVTSSTLSSNREVQNWASALRKTVFDAVPGLAGQVTRLENLGIDFLSGTSELAVLDSAKLDNLLSEEPQDVVAFFQQSSTGFAARLNSLLDGYLGINGGDGLLESQRGALTSNSTSLDQQIADIERRLVQRRSLLESGFIAMETAQSKLKQMQTMLSNAFPTNSNTSK